MKYKVEMFVNNSDWKVISATDSIDIALARLIMLKKEFPYEKFRVVELLAIS